MGKQRQAGSLEFKAWYIVNSRTTRATHRETIHQNKHAIHCTLSSSVMVETDPRCYTTTSPVSMVLFTSSSSELPDDLYFLIFSSCDAGKFNLVKRKKEDFYSYSVVYILVSHKKRKRLMFCSSVYQA